MTEFHIYQAQRRQNILFHTATTTWTTQFYERKHKNFHTHQTTKHTNTTRTIKTATPMWLSLLTKSWCFYNWDSANTVVSILKLRNKSAKFAHFIHHEFCTFHRFPKFCTWLAEQFHIFHPSLHESVTGSHLM